MKIESLIPQEETPHMSEPKRLPPPLCRVSGFPKNGWTLREVEDHEEPSASCQFCGTKDGEIRYEHLLAHPDWPHVVRAGCDCSGLLIGDPARAKDEERKARRRAARRKRWASLKSWKPSPKGYTRIFSALACRVTVFRSGSAWKLVVGGEFGRLTYPTPEAAALRSFDVLTKRLAKDIMKNPSKYHRYFCRAFGVDCAAWRAESARAQRLLDREPPAAEPFDYEKSLARMREMLLRDRSIPEKIPNSSDNREQ